MAYNRDPRPDFATVFETNSNEKYERLLAPVFAVGEVKQEDTGVEKAKSGNVNTAIYTSQMQSAVFPTLILFALLQHMEDSHSKSGRSHGQLPESYILYGIYMDDKQIIIYAHLPLYDTKQGGWRFVQVRLATYHIPSFGDAAETATIRGHMEEENAPTRLQIMLALITVRSRVAKSKDWFINREKEKWDHLTSLWKSQGPSK